MAQLVTVSSPSPPPITATTAHHRRHPPRCSAVVLPSVQRS
ncbi:MAG: hypothetical protein Q4D23_03995 [Bacteroidales bacterium]|nr:hypothetical protein [Bacteroidales bacterium]